MKRLRAVILWQPFYATVEVASIEMCWDAFACRLCRLFLVAVSSVQQLSQAPQLRNPLLAFLTKTSSVTLLQWLIQTFG